MADLAVDSHLVDRARPGLAYRRGILLPRMGAPVATVVHTTSGGPRARYLREGARKGDRDVLDTTLRIYGTIMEPAPHYVVDQLGQVAQVTPEALCAWHVGGAKSAPYHRLGTSWIPRALRARYAWWQARWQGLDGPRDLAGGQLWAPYVVGPSLAQRTRHPLSWGKGSVNAWSIGIEVIPPADPGAPWSPECWRALAELIVDIHRRQGVPLERDRVITHSDAHPLSRTTPKGTPWDTVEAQWSWERFEAEVAGAGLAVR